MGGQVKIICGEVNGVKGPVQNIIIKPEYLDVTVPPGKGFAYPIAKGKTAFACVIAGKGYFDRKRDSYAHPVEGANYFDFKKEYLFGSENLIRFED